MLAALGESHFCRGKPIYRVGEAMRKLLTGRTARVIHVTQTRLESEGSEGLGIALEVCARSSNRPRVTCGSLGRIPSLNSAISAKAGLCVQKAALSDDLSTKVKSKGLGENILKRSLKTSDMLDFMKRWKRQMFHFSAGTLVWHLELNSRLNNIRSERELNALSLL